MTDLIILASRHAALDMLTRFVLMAGGHYASGRNTDHGPGQPATGSRLSALAYPAPFVDNAGAMREAREALFGLRRAAGHGHAAQKIAAKHGSRRADIPITGRNKAPARRSAANAQLKLDL